MSFTRAGRRLLSLPLTEVVDLFAAQSLLLAARRDLKRKPRGQLLRPVASTDVRGADGARRDCGEYLARMAVAIDRVARYGMFRPTCLIRAMALERVARHAEPRAAVRIGVIRRADALFAHAWLECGGRVIGEDPDRVRVFVPLHDFSALPE